MKITKFHIAPVLIALAFATLDAAAAEGPYVLQHTILNPGTGPQTGINQGWSVAVDGNIIVAGATGDDTGAENSGVVKVYDATTGAWLNTLTNPTPAPYDYFGSSVAISGTRVVVGAPFDDTGALEAGSAYVYDLASATPTVPVATLNNPNPVASDGFGGSVSISGTRVVVGVSGADLGALEAGSVYVYDLASATPTVPVARLENPTPAPGDQFGRSVAISGTRAVVGAPFDDAGAEDAGSAYVYDLASATPTVPVVTLNNPNPTSGVGYTDQYGYSVAISGTRVVVGANQDETVAEAAGRAYVYDLASATPTVPVFTLEPNPVAYVNFGGSVAISGTRVVVGAVWEESAYVYDLVSATPTVPMATLNNPSPGSDPAGPSPDQYGYSVSISGTQVVIGAPWDRTVGNGEGDGTGNAFLYDLAGATPTLPVFTLNHPSLGSLENFGNTLAISGTRVVVGVSADNTGANGSGSAYVYDTASATPTVPVATLHHPSPAEGDQFGYSVSISGTRVVVGAPGIFSNGLGTAYVYDLTSATPTVPVVMLKIPNAGILGFFGWSVAISGKWIVVGAIRVASGNNYSVGRAYVFDLASATPTMPVFTLNNPSPAQYDQFGSSVALSGTRLVVGTPGDDTGARDAGTAYVYDLASATPTVPVFTLNNPSPAIEDHFGLPVTISGTRVVVGAYRDDTGATDAGSAYVYDLAGATPTVPVATLNNPSPTINGYFGGSVSIAGSRLVVGPRAYLYEVAGATPTVPMAMLGDPTPAGAGYFGAAVAIDGTAIVAGAPWVDGVTVDRGAAYIFTPSIVGPRLAIAPDGGSGYFVRFTGDVGASYRLQRAASVTGPWNGIATNTAPASGLIEYHETTPPSEAAFYRTVQP